jgi:hypothetical protein
VIYRVRLKPNIDPEFGRRNFYVIFRASAHGTDEVIGMDEVCIPSLVPGEWREARGKFRIPKSYGMVQINAYLGTTTGHNYRVVGKYLRLYLVDSTAGQYGTGIERYNQMMNVFWKYDHLSAQWLNVPDPRWGDSNRRIAEEIKGFDPALTDSEALCLHGTTIF